MTHRKIISIFLAISAFVFVQSTPGQGWRAHSIDATGDLVAIHFTTSRKGFVGGDNGYLAFTVDGGKTWRQYPLNTTEDINEIYFRNEDNGYIVAGRKLFITSDGGSSWRETSILRDPLGGGQTPVFLSIRFADRRRGLAIGSVLNQQGRVVDSLVMRTANGGESWDRMIVPSKAELFFIDFNGSSHGWIVGDKGLILATTNGGETWQVQNSNTTNALYNVDFRDDDVGYAVGEAGTILRTENGGRVWEKIKNDVTATLLRVVFTDDRNGWIIGRRGVILHSRDKGRTWDQANGPTTKHLYGLYMSRRFGWAVGADGLLLEFRP
ncbi:MAG TPA: YCF48-related protein [Pyrinomonadaceae bacterium]|nr:YCF48-related protein [Pyrinomonadaceae bacterium]